MIAILADVHANFAALSAVADELRRRQPSQILCLGDMVGYGAEPNQCIDLLIELGCEAVIGNHDRCALGVNDPFASRQAVRVQEWTGTRLSEQSRQFLSALPTRRDYRWGHAVHGCYTNPLHITGYVTPTTAANNLAALAGEPRVALFGHTHVPTLYSTAWPDLNHPGEGRVELPTLHTVLANPGSVGQPRDGDRRASFALFDPDEHWFEVVRVEYDLERTIAAMTAAGFDEGLAERLKEGR